MCTSWHLGFCGYDHPFTKLDQICKPLILIGQTTVLEGGTKDAMRISKEALFRGVSTQLFGPRTMEKVLPSKSALHLLFSLSKIFVWGA
jgi:hypothetical protein